MNFLKNSYSLTFADSQYIISKKYERKYSVVCEARKADSDETLTFEIDKDIIERFIVDYDNENNYNDYELSCCLIEVLKKKYNVADILAEEETANYNNDLLVVRVDDVAEYSIEVLAETADKVTYKAKKQYVFTDTHTRRKVNNDITVIFSIDVDKLKMFEYNKNELISSAIRLNVIEYYSQYFSLCK